MCSRLAQVWQIGWKRSTSLYRIEPTTGPPTQQLDEREHDETFYNRSGRLLRSIHLEEAESEGSQT